MTDDLLWLGFVAATYMQRDRRPLHPRRRGAVPRRRGARAALRPRPARVPARLPAHEPARDPLHRRRRLERRPLGDGPGGARRIGLAGAVPRRPAGGVVEGLRCAPAAKASRESSPAAARSSSAPSTSTAGTATGTGAPRWTTAAASAASADRVGRIFLNAQTWAILNDVAPPDAPPPASTPCGAPRDRSRSAAARARLRHSRPEIGYITRYAPGLRENGGVYTHAATWAIAAAAKMKDGELVGRLLAAIEPGDQGPRPLLRRAVRPARQRRRARLAAPRPRGLDLVHRLRRLAATASSPSGCWACGPSGTVCASIPACRRAGTAPRWCGPGGARPGRSRSSAGRSPRVELDGAALPGNLIPVLSASGAGRRRVRVVVA